MRKPITAALAALAVIAGALFAAPSAEASTLAWGGWHNCTFTVGHWTPVRWQFETSGTSKRVRAVEWGNGNSETIDNYDLWETYNGTTQSGGMWNRWPSPSKAGSSLSWGPAAMTWLSPYGTRVAHVRLHASSMNWPFTNCYADVSF